MYVGCLCSVNGPVEGVLIDSFSPLSFSLSPVPRVACISPASPAASPCVALPSLQFGCRGDRWLGESKTEAGNDRWKVEEERMNISEIRLLLDLPWCAGHGGVF